MSKSTISLPPDPIGVKTGGLETSQVCDGEIGTLVFDKNGQSPEVGKPLMLAYDRSANTVVAVDLSNISTATLILLGIGCVVSPTNDPKVDSKKMWVAIRPKTIKRRAETIGIAHTYAALALCCGTTFN